MANRRDINVLEGEEAEELAAYITRKIDRTEREVLSKAASAEGVVWTKGAQPKSVQEND
jgi:hypothetical protein